MDYFKNFGRQHIASRLCRIEKKCDNIISELRTIRQCLTNPPSKFDDAIDRMHRNARRMRAAASKDAMLIRKLFRQNLME